MPKIKAKKTHENIPREITEYPKTDNILYTDSRRSYYYTVIQEGLYGRFAIETKETLINIVLR